MLLFLSRFFFSNSNFEHERDGRCYGFLGFLGGASLRPLAWKRKGGIAGNPWVVAQSGTLLALRVNAAPASCRASSSLIPSSRLSYRSCTRHFLTRRFSKIGWKYMINREIKIRENCFEETEWKRERERKIGANAFINSTRKLEKERKECLLKRGIVDFPILLREILLVPFVK